MRVIGAGMLAVLLACAPAPADDTGLTPPSPTDTGTPTDSTTPAPVDGDGDGWADDEDCDDNASDVYPGAPESWDGRDGDCDGRVDADGAYAGALSFTARAIYQGVPYDYALACPTTLDRGGGVLAFEMVCRPDAEDPTAVLLLGETLTLVAGDELMGGDSWSGEATLASSGGWSAPVDLLLSWPDLDHAEAWWRIDTTSLDAGASGTVTVQ